jgi:hypothetical protein
MTMGHDHASETAHGPTGAATVLTDIGGDVGAAVVYVPEHLAGLEIEIRAVGAEWDGTHTGVRERHVGGAVLHAGFFGTLHAGRYEVRLRDDDARAVPIEVCGGAVTEARW